MMRRSLLKRALGAVGTLLGLPLLAEAFGKPKPEDEPLVLKARDPVCAKLEQAFKRRIAPSFNVIVTHHPQCIAWYWVAITYDREGRHWFQNLFLKPEDVGFWDEQFARAYAGFWWSLADEAAAERNDRVVQCFYMLEGNQGHEQARNPA